MTLIRKTLIIAIITLGATLLTALYFNPVICSLFFGQEEVAVSALADGKPVTQTASQPAASKAQTRVTATASPTLTAMQVAIPLPQSLGDGLIVGEPGGIAAGITAIV